MRIGIFLLSIIFLMIGFGLMINYAEVHGLTVRPSNVSIAGIVIAFLSAPGVAYGIGARKKKKKEKPTLY